MNSSFYIFKRIALESNRSFSKLIVRIAITGICVGIAVMMIAIAVVNGFQTSVPKKLIGFWGHIQISKLDLDDSFESKPIVFNPELVENLQEKPFTKHIQTYALKAGVAKTDSAFEGVVLKGIDKKFDWTILEENLTAGKKFEIVDSVKSNETVIPKFLADRLNLKVGDKMNLYFIQQPPRQRRFTISGIYNLGIESEFGKPFILTDLRHIQKLNNWKNRQIGGYELFINDFEQLDQVGEEVREMIDIESNSMTIKELYPPLFSWLNLFDINETIIIIIMILVAGINMISALLILILERTRMIGLLKTFGMNNRNIQKIFLYNGTYLISIGLILGNILGLGILFLQKNYEIIRLPEDLYYVTAVPIEISIWQILLLNLGVLLACFFMLILPSFIISKITPIKAIRFS